MKYSVAETQCADLNTPISSAERKEEEDEHTVETWALCTTFIDVLIAFSLNISFYFPFNREGRFSYFLLSQEKSRKGSNDAFCLS